MRFQLTSKFKPAGDQPKAIEKLVSGLKAGYKEQTLLGVTGSGKTFVMANVIQQIQKPTLIISHNKTLAGQLYQEFRDFFPKNAVEYFVSYYDYYQPESYLPATDTYIEKDADINEEINKLRMSTTEALINRKDVIVVASVSCIYNLGSPVEYQKQLIKLSVGENLRQRDLLERLDALQYVRNDFEFKRGTYRVRGDSVDVFLPYRDYAMKITFLDDLVTKINRFDPITGEVIGARENSVVDAEESYPVANSLEHMRDLVIYPAKHYVTPKDRFKTALKDIQADLAQRIKELKKAGKELEAYRLEQRTNYDLEMISEIGYCKGIENYSRYFDGRKPGEPPFSLLDYFSDDYLLFIDESHITVPQIRGMYNGDRSRKNVLIEHGFRLPSALDNRPLRFDEFQRRMGRVIYTSATPAKWEMERSDQVVELLVRPTGLVDPSIKILPTKGQISDLEKRIIDKVSKKERILVTTLTKKMAEELAEYLEEKGFSVAYLHSDINTLERSDILENLRNGTFDVLVGINLLREGLDLPEVSLVAVLDADKEGFLRSETALIQIMGRAARHNLGEVVMYADNITGSMERAIKEVERRRAKQLSYNKLHNITPVSIKKPIRKRILAKKEVEESLPIKELNIKDYEFKTLPVKNQKAIIKSLEKKMRTAAEIMEFEVAAKIRDKILALKTML